MFAFNPNLTRGLYFRFRGIWAAMPFPYIPTGAEYIVVNGMSPNCEGYYLYKGEYNGKSYYQRSVGDFYLWWNTVAMNCWVISLDFVFGGNMWYKTGDIVGFYTPSGEYTGSPQVRAL